MSDVTNPEQDDEFIAAKEADYEPDDSPLDDDERPIDDDETGETVPDDDRPVPLTDDIQPE